MKNRNHNRFNSDIEKSIIELYELHQSLGVVSSKLGIHKTSISRVLKRFEIPIKANNSGSDHPHWRGGINNNKGDGYLGIWSPGHERADNGSYVYAHTLEYEKHTGKLPKKGEVLHHIDLDKRNNDFSNLFLCDNKKHIQLHRKIEKLIKPLMELGLIVFENGDYVLNEKIDLSLFQ